MFAEQEIIQLIDKCLSTKSEHNNLDFKKEVSPKKERLKEHINAFGNNKTGGTFVYGVNAFKVEGFQGDFDETILFFSQLAKDTQEPPLNINTFVHKITGKDLLCIHVSPASQRPVFIKDRVPLGGEACFKRTGTSTVAMSMQEVRDSLARSSQHSFDESTLLGREISDLDEDLLRASIKELNDSEISSVNNINVLFDQGIVAEPRVKDYITAAGWLCFAKDPQSEKKFQNAVIEFQIFKGTTRESPLRAQVFQGPLVNQIEYSIDILLQHMWEMPKILGKKRVDIPSYNEEILREVVTNSIVHRDYTKMHQPVKIALFTDRLEFENPGGLMPGLTPLNLIHRRDWRNPLLAKLMKKCGFGDMDGQGIDRLFNATRLIKIPAPKFVDTRVSFKVVLSGPKGFDDFTAEEKRLTAMVLLITEDYIDNESLRNALGISQEKASTLLKSLVQDNVIVQTNKSRKYAKYGFSEVFQERVNG